MKQKLITFFVGFFGMGLFYGILLSFTSEGSSKSEIIIGAVFFGVVWGLAEVFIFPWIRNKFKRKE